MGRSSFIFYRPTCRIKGYLLPPLLLQFIAAAALFMLSIWSKDLKEKHRESKDAHITQRFDIRNSIYFPHSKSMNANTVVIIFNAHRDFIYSGVSLLCHANSPNNSTINKAYLRYASWPAMNCKWNTFIAECKTLPNMGFLGLSTLNIRISEQLNEIVELPFMHAITTKLDVVSCISPLFFFERWQMLFTFIEIYRHFGVARQSIYVSSILTNIMRILQEYEKYEYIELVPWAMLNKEDRDDEVDPNSEMSWRNQETAMNECLFKYKESASFILFIDVDEILIPTSNSYYEDFQLLTKNTKIASFAFEKFYLRTPTNIIPANYSMSKMISRSSLDPLMKGEGKTIVIPSKISSIWIHWPPKQSIASGYRHVEINRQVNFFFHPRYWKYEELPEPKKRKVIFRNRETTMQPHYNEYSKTFHERQQSLKHRIDAVEKSFIDFISTNQLLEVFNKLNVSFIYDSMFDKCFTDLIDRNLETRRDYCPTSTECDIPNLYGMGCTVAQTFFTSNIVQNRRIYIVSVNRFVNVTNGCFHP